MTYHSEPGKANGGRLVKARTENLSKSKAMVQIPADERPSYLRRRQIALKKFTSQGGAASAS